MDLASVAWAWCLSLGGQPRYETCAWYFTDEDAALASIVSPWDVGLNAKSIKADGEVEFGGSYCPDVIVIEDLPYNMKATPVIKNTVRMQGRIIDRIARVGHKDRILFVPPALWQRSMGVWRMTPKQTGEVAKDLGYTPPDLITDHADAFAHLHHKERQDVRGRLKKLMTDYVDAFLIAEWAHKTYAEHGTLDIKNTQRYDR